MMHHFRQNGRSSFPRRLPPPRLKKNSRCADASRASRARAVPRVVMACRVVCLCRLWSLGGGGNKGAWGWGDRGVACHRAGNCRRLAPAPLHPPSAPPTLIQARRKSRREGGCGPSRGTGGGRRRGPPPAFVTPRPASASRATDRGRPATRHRQRTLPCALRVKRGEEKVMSVLVFSLSRKKREKKKVRGGPTVGRPGLQKKKERETPGRLAPQHHQPFRRATARWRCPLAWPDGPSFSRSRSARAPSPPLPPPAPPLSPRRRRQR